MNPSLYIDCVAQICYGMLITKEELQAVLEDDDDFNHWWAVIEGWDESIEGERHWFEKYKEFCVNHPCPVELVTFNSFEAPYDERQGAIIAIKGSCIIEDGAASFMPSKLVVSERKQNQLIDFITKHMKIKTRKPKWYLSYWIGTVMHKESKEQ